MDNLDQSVILLAAALSPYGEFETYSFFLQPGEGSIGCNLGG